MSRPFHHVVLVRRSILRFPFIGFIVLAVVSQMASTVQAAESELTNDEKVAAILSELNSFESLWATYSITSGPLEVNGKVVRPGGEISNYEWAMQGNKRRELNIGRDHSTFCDCDFIYGYIQYDEHPHQLSFIRVADSDREMGGFSPRLLIGSSLHVAAGSLAELISRDPGRISAEKVNGVECVKFHFDAVRPLLGKNDFQIDVWFDPNHDFLPARILARISPNATSPAAYIAKFKSDLEITEFQRVMDHRRGEDRWFPKSCVITQASDYKKQWVFNDVRLNDTLEDSLFVPDIPDGTYVYFRTREEYAEIVIKAAEETLAEVVQRAEDAPRKPIPRDPKLEPVQIPDLNAIDETTAGTSSMFTALLLANVVALILGVGYFIWRRYQNNVNAR
ncbi:MAG: hypothetical protein WEB58_22200 [Planctomycetaceae bacterium]